MGDNKYYIVSWSGGKDSTATIVLAKENNIPIDEIVISLIWFDKKRKIYAEWPKVLRMDKETFHSRVEPRKDIVEEVRNQVEREKITGKLIHLCFTCDPYPRGYDTTPTREIIKILKDVGNNVQILTKGNGMRDFDLLDSGDWYGITIDGARSSEGVDSEASLIEAHKHGIKTWISYEPVVYAPGVINHIEMFCGCVDKIKIGKLNYFPSETDWLDFGLKVESLCKGLGIDYYIKDSLRKEMGGDEHL